MHWAGIVGTPGDMVNVRMQNDIKLPKEQRRKYVSISQNYFIRQKYFLRPWNYFSYNHAIDGLIRVSREEGVKKLFNGVDWATARAVLMTIGQLCFYDQIKALLLGTPYFSDNLITHFTSSLCAVRRRKYLRLKYCSLKFQGAIATTMTQPLDVLKTRAMNAKPGEFKGALDLIKFTARGGGPMAFYKVK